MVRPLLAAVYLGGLAAVLAACGPEAGAEGGHADLACATCHRGGQAETGRAAVPAEACTASGCHSDHGPAEVALATVEFGHRDHGAAGPVALGCAGCHTHEEGDEALRASVDACVLCHQEQVASAAPGECELCHPSPDHVATTAEGLPVSHAALPTSDIGCVRCHYDVTDPQVHVSAARCTACHEERSRAIARGIAVDMHPAHVGVTCTACHAEDLHQINAISSAVSLVCADCHQQAHGLRLSIETAPAADACRDCHARVHDPQQRLVLGIVPGGQAAPSAKFLAGLSCRSCHVATAGQDSVRPIRGQEESCVGCHRSEYATVLDWWLAGLAQRERLTRAYLQTATGRLGSGAGRDGAAALERAGSLLRLIEAAGGQHNLELTDRLFRQVVEEVGEAYESAGMAPPAPPALGNPARLGFCSYCHYSLDDRFELRAMPEELHRQLGVQW